MTPADRLKLAYARRQEAVPPERDGYFDRGTLLENQERERTILRLLARYAQPLDRQEILEVGCGSGHWLRALVQYGASPERLTGVDLLPGSIARARRTCAPGVRLEVADCAQLRFPDRTFDLVLQSTVFSSILEPAVRRRVASEMVRVLRPGGAILWYDARVGNPFNPDLVGIGAREISRLFPGCAVELERLTLVPPLARWLAPRSPAAVQLLARLPPLATHLFAAIRPRASQRERAASNSCAAPRRNGDPV